MHCHLALSWKRHIPNRSLHIRQSRCKPEMRYGCLLSTRTFESFCDSCFRSFKVSCTCAPMHGTNLNNLEPQTCMMMGVKFRSRNIFERAGHAVYAAGKISTLHSSAFPRLRRSSVQQKRTVEISQRTRWRDAKKKMHPQH